MTTTITAPLIIIIDHSEKHLELFNNWRDYEHHGNFRAIKKQFSRNNPALIVACIASEEDEKFCQQVTEFVRQGLSNIDTRIVLMRDPEFDVDEIYWMENFQVNCCLLAEKSRQAFNLSALNRELDTFLHIDSNRCQHDAETDMLMCITQFSKENEPLSTLLKNFSATLSDLCYSQCCFHLAIKDNDSGTIDYCDQADPEIIEHFNSSMNLPEIPNYLSTALSEKQPQINLLPETMDLTFIEEKLKTTIGSYLTFPISSYNKVLYLLVYFISDADMDKVSMRQINVINKASEQLTMLLERRQAETSLKKQYHRLKSALVELKTTKTELSNKEKMASIGQMAAGIAHEINNPLSYVISNFSSMDHYLKSIMQLQELQSEFLTSIDVGQDQRVQTLKKDINEFKEEQDISFVLEDIRAVVSDSHNGLKRVKNIINDLKSFTYSQSTQLEICDLNKVTEETLKILQYEIGDGISIQTTIAKLPPFMAHNGLMQQVVSNLVKNAAQALKEANTSDPTISITAEHENNLIHLRIRDNGPGIPEEVRHKIFEPFFTTKTVGEGTGLGLSVTFNIIKKLGGEINLSSEPNQFTEFHITFPISEEKP